MSHTSKLVVTLRKWDVDSLPLEDEAGDVYDTAIQNEYMHEYHYARRDYPRGPQGKAELIADLVEAFKGEGVDFASTGNDWATLPDGSYTLDYRTGATREVSMHFGPGTPFYVIRDVMNGVG